MAMTLHVVSKRDILITDDNPQTVADGLSPSLSKFLNFSLFRPIFGKYENVSC